MAQLSLTYQWNGEPHKYEFPTSLTPLEVQLKVHQIWNDGFARIPTSDVHADSECPRTVYIIPVHQILRLAVELEENEECPDVET